MINWQEFIEQNQPAGKRSSLDPYRDAIFEIKERGFTNKQIREFLSLNGVKVSQGTIRLFLATRAKDVEKQNVETTEAA